MDIHLGCPRHCRPARKIHVNRHVQEMVIVGVLDTGYPGLPAPGPLQRPNFGPGVNRRPKPNGEDPHEEAPHEAVLSKKIRTEDSVPSMLPRQGGDPAVPA
jgi:hypothetical protein